MVSKPLQKIVQRRALVRILLFTDTLGDANGVSRFVTDMGREAQESQGELHIFGSTLKKRYESALYIHNEKPFWRFRMPFYPELDLAIPPFWRFWSLAKELNPDIIHISTPGFVGLCGRIIAKRLGKPLCGTYHTDFPAYIMENTQSSFLKRLSIRCLRWFYAPFSRLLLRSLVHSRELLEELRIEPSRVGVIQAGIDLTRFGPRFRDRTIWKEWGLCMNAPKALYVGRLNKEKNFLFLLEAWRELKAHYAKPLELVVVGEGEFSGALADEDLDIHYLGFKGGEELSKIYASSDFFLFPSRTDTLGQAVMEACASGLPAVVSDEGGPKEIVSMTQSGYILDAKNHKAWKEAIIHLAQEPLVREEWGKRGASAMLSLGIRRSWESFYKEHQKVPLV